VSILKLLLLPICISLLSACGPSGQQELEQWMAELKATTKPVVKPLSEPKQFNPEPYVVQGVMDPFNISKLTLAISRDSAQNASNAEMIAEQRKRRKEPLEAFPLDAMVMVGSLSKELQPTALLKIGNLIYQVKAGNYIGQNYGLITRITETEVELLEIVQDATGDWVKRTASLDLQEGNKK
jgi:type IV pilus assembly protein PilP